LPDRVLSQQALNRALLARQHLIEPRSATALQEIEHLVGMQAQIPNAPYVGLWSRLENFTPSELGSLIERRQAVRIGILRNTIHLMSGRDALRLWPLFQSLLAQRLRTSPFGRTTVGIDLEAVVTEAARLFREKPRTLAQLGVVLHERWPKAPAASLAYVTRHLMPLVQVPPRGVWGKRGQPTWSTAEVWLGRSLESEPSADSLIRRYLRAFGPASIADIAEWSGLTGLRAVIQRLRPELRTFKDERGRELFDVPEGPLPDPGTPVPPRFLPEYDNLLLGHQDRSRVIAFEHRHVVLNGTFLLDGIVAGTWSLSKKRDGSRLVVSSFRSLRKAERAGLADEAERLLAFAAPSFAKTGIDFVVAPPGAPSAPTLPSSEDGGGVIEFTHPPRPSPAGGGGSKLKS
jgi:winged helix DNA-binding protein